MDMTGERRIAATRQTVWEALNDPANAVPDNGAASPQAASAAAQAQARVQSLAAQAAREVQAAEAAQAATAQQASAASAPASDDGTAGPDAYRNYAKAKVGATQFGCTRARSV